VNEKRRAKKLKELASLEQEFRSKLVRALERCASGAWGLFGQNDHLADSPSGLVDAEFEGSGAKEIVELGEAINSLRRELGDAAAFPPYASFLSLRGRKDGNALGDARLAKEWLDRLKTETN
jgi:hypothetical protein